MDERTKERQQYRYKKQFTRPEIRIIKEDNEKIKSFVSGKGYKSINDYLNALIYADMQYNFIPSKQELVQQYPTSSPTHDDQSGD